MIEILSILSPDIRLMCVPAPNLVGADLTDACLVHADLRRMLCSGASFRGANLKGADLSGSDLQMADFTGASLVAADLNDADLRGADLSTARLVDTDLDGALYDRFTRWPAGFDAALQGAHVDGAEVCQCPPGTAELPRCAAGKHPLPGDPNLCPICLRHNRHVARRCRVDSARARRNADFLQRQAHRLRERAESARVTG